MHSPAKLTVLVAASALIGGCSLFGGGDDNDKHRDRNNRGGQTVGDYREAGKGRLSWTSPGTGQVTVRDREDSHVVLTQWVRQGDRIVVSPDEDLVSLNGQRIYNKNLVKDHEHAIVFQPDGGGPGGQGRYDNRPDMNRR